MQLQRWSSRCIDYRDWIRVGDKYIVDNDIKSNRLMEVLISLSRRLEFPQKLPIFIMLSERQFGWEWHVYAHFLSAQQSVQRTAFGKSARIWLANKIIRFGWWLARIGSR